MKKILSVLLLTVLFSSSANAYKVYGAGVKSCGVWIAEKEKNSVAFYRMTDWLQGFVSGVGYVADFELKKTDGDAKALFVTNYCNANPLDKVADAAYKLIDALEI
jgi:hypothetical protein